MELDYKKLGFKCGIEIHQELSTKKLFCSDSTSFSEKKEIFTIRRKLRPAAGESNKTDIAALYEFHRDRDFVYHGYENESCLVESDSEPPHQVDKDALETSLGVAKLFNLKVPHTICVMRKTVTDGSAISGFQRTMLVGIESTDSYLETSKGKIKVIQLNLEEDSCKIIKREGNVIHYSLSRLGIPLLELGTDATVKDPEHAKEVSKKLGMILRSFKFVKRGLGTIRQDVNISIKGGARIEVKGWQELKTIPLLVKNEVLRQINLLKIKDKLKKRGLKNFNIEKKDVTNIFKNCKSKLLSQLIKNKSIVVAIKLPKFSGLLKTEVCTGKTFGKELSEYAKAFGTKGMIHSDEDLKKYGLEKELVKVKKILNAKGEDLIVIIAEQEQIAHNAADAVYERALHCLKGVPEETRIPNHKDATSSYARPLPGANRLYPETDVPNIKINKSYLKKIPIPELIEDKITRYSNEYKISSELAKEIIEKGINFGEYRKKYRKLKSSFIAEAFINYEKEIKKRYNLSVDSIKHIPILLEKANTSKINNDAIFEILLEIAKGKKIDYNKYKPLSKKDIENMIKKVMSKNKGAPLNAIIGQVMDKLRGKVSGKEVVNLIKKMY